MYSVVDAKATAVADALSRVVNEKRTSEIAAMNGKNKFLLGLLYPYPCIASH
jgi:hypothetical protein